MKANNSLGINMPRALELISFFFLGHGPTYPIFDLSGSAITRGNFSFVIAKKQTDGKPSVVESAIATNKIASIN